MSTLTYGFIEITRGKFKGRAAYYDDDTFDGRLIVYFGAPCLSEWTIVRPDSVKQISSKEASALGWTNQVKTSLAV